MEEPISKCGDIRQTGGAGQMQRNKAVVAVALYLGMFLFMLVLNVLTLYIADDFRYLYSFYDRSHRIESISDIIMSMRAHRYNMNGRLVAHTIVQFFGMLPLWVFDILNALAYVLQIALVYQLGRNRAPRSNWMLAAIFCGMWLTCPHYSAVNLWQDGALNYLWSTVLALLYLRVFIREYLYDSTIRTVFGKICFYCLSFGMGAYSETASAAAIFMTMLMVALLVLDRKKKLRLSWLASIAVACLGYVTIYLSPAQWREKSAEMTLSTLLDNFVTCARMYWDKFGLLLCIFVIALVLNLLLRMDRKQILLGLVFFAGSLAGNFILTFAQYYAARSAYGAFVYLLAADVILLYPLLGNRKCRKLLLALFAVTVVVAIPSMVTGGEDVYDVYQQMKRNEAYIYECKENGILDIQVPMITGKTVYSVGSSNKYLDTEDASIWPNYSMSYYYGVNSIIGVWPD